MPKDVFISYAQGDRQWAEQVCAQVEEAGIPCWIAPRDIAPGVTWPAAITEAIRGCRAMIVVFSSHANQSRQMAREVEVADSRHVPILPVRVEEIEPAGDMEYFLGNRQWFDLHGGKVERRRALPDAIASLLGQTELMGAAVEKLAGATVAPPKPAAASRAPVWIAIGIAAAVGLALAFFILRTHPAAGRARNAEVTAPASPKPAEVATGVPPAATPAPASTAAPAESAPPKPRTGAAVGVGSSKPVAQPKAAVEASSGTTLPPPPPAPKATANFAGKWEAEVKYSWGSVHKEIFLFKVDENDVMGTASYVGSPRGILDGKIEGNRISFLTKSQTLLGSQTYEEKHAYKGRLIGDAIEFILQTDSGYDTRTPEMFSARRVE